MPGGKVHGMGGHGRHGREAARKYAHQRAAMARILRAQRKKSSAGMRRVSEVMKVIAEELNPAVAQLSEKVLASVNAKRITPRTGAIIELALDAWYKERIAGEMKKQKIPEDVVRDVLKGDIGILDEEHKAMALEAYLGKSPSAETQKNYFKDQLPKWVRRIPLMLKEGRYL